MIRDVMSPYEYERRFGLKLDPCPFCGSGNVGLFCGPTPHITCVDCKADGPAITVTRNGSDIELCQHTAGVVWNTRHMTVKEELEQS